LSSACSDKLNQVLNIPQMNLCESQLADINSFTEKK
jgi:hypothetical protein